MSTNKKTLLLPLVAIVSLIVNAVLLYTNCNSDGNNTKPNTAERRRDQTAQSIPPKHAATPKNTACEDDEDCPEEEICEDSKCITLDDLEKEYIDAGNGTPTDASNFQSPRSCSSAEDCGCGYECKYDECHRLESSCNVNGDCNTGYFCAKSYEQICGTCIKPECKTDTDCGNACNDHCEKNLCVQYGCCNDSDCGIDHFCYKYGGQEEGRCKQVECYKDSDCGCGFVCDQESKNCTGRSTDRPIACCGGYFYYKKYGACVPQYLIEDGNCLDNSHCKQGEVCNEEQDVCYPATCEENADCGFEAVCRKGHCEHGCDDNSNCNDEYPICDRGECTNPGE